MAIRSKTPSAPAKRSKNTSGESAPATEPAKAGGRRKSGAAEQPAKQSKGQSAAQETSGGLAAAQAVELVPDAPLAPGEPQPASTGASAGRDERAGRALDALKLLGEVISEGVDTLRELRAEMRTMSGRLDQLAAASQVGSGGQATTDADDYQVGRDHDPGDAVPPGVAVISPTPLSDSDEQVLHSLEELPKRGGRQGKRGPRAKA